MTKTFNKKAQSGVAIALASATIAIALIIGIFALMSTLFTLQSAIKTETAIFSSSIQAEKSLLSMLESKSGNMTFSDALRLSRQNTLYREGAKKSLESFDNVYKSWAFYSLDISEGYFKKKATQIQIPDFRGTINANFEVTDE